MVVPWFLMIALALPHQTGADAHRAAPGQQVQIKLQGLGLSEADLLIGKLRDAQRKLRAGKKLYFELLTGGPASYSIIETSPRRAFLDMNFEKPWSIERQPTTGLRQPYELTYFPHLMWKVNVVEGQTGELVRVEMLYTAPPPF